MADLKELTNLGQSVWVDYIRRSFIDDGGLEALIQQGVRGVTSNPSIFEKAITGSSDYDDDLRQLVSEGKTAGEIYEALALDDIARAADILRPLYDETDGGDGFVSLEVSPALANDTDSTIAEARRLFGLLNRPNIMIKVPATEAGIPAIRTLIGEGINVNVTLIFAVQRYEQVINAYLDGLEQYVSAGGDVSKVASVASFFVSRVETSADKALDAKGIEELKGTIAVANAKVAYARFQELFSGKRWDALAAKGAKVQRPLWASTGTKNPMYADTKYVDELIGPHTVNTAPPDTIDAFIDHGTAAHTLDANVDEAYAQIKRLGELGIDLDAITADLLEDGVTKFAKSFDSLMEGIESKREAIKADFHCLTSDLQGYQGQVDEALEELRRNEIMHRIWKGDHTVWQPDPTEITNRLGWLHTADVMMENLDRLYHLVEDVRAAGYTHALLLGMGGSSLAPEVFRKTFGVADGYLDVAVLDSTDPGAVLAYDEQLDPAKTLFIVSTKSGGTAETLSFFKYFYNRTLEEVGQQDAGNHFIAITDPGSKLQQIADRYHFRATFLNDPNIGGRYSALSYFGIVPAALLGIDLERLLNNAMTMAVNCDANNCPSEGDNNGGKLGAIMGELARAGRDKLTFITSPSIASFEDWVEQLIAESTGKEGTGILPVVGEPLGKPQDYGSDRLFVHLCVEGDSPYDDLVDTLVKAGHPLVQINLNDVYDLGGQFFLWEMATAVAGHRLGINPFNQPNVEAAKVQARSMISAYEQEGKLPELEPALRAAGMTVYGNVSADDPGQALREFILHREDGAYVALQAYLKPDANMDVALNNLRHTLRDAFKIATTSGYGPRFLHSTGQLHKGDAGHGLFIQFTADMPRDADIPDEAGEDASTMSFGTLKEAQALGDRQALLDNGRRVLRIHLGADPVGALRKLQETVT